MSLWDSLVDFIGCILYDADCVRKRVRSAEGCTLEALPATCRFKRRFRSAKPETGETPIQFLTRLDNHLLRWIDLAKAEKSFEGLKTLMVQEQYLSTCQKDMAMHLKEGKLRTIRELGEIAENYVEAHATDIVFGIETRQQRIRSLKADMRRCQKQRNRSPKGPVSEQIARFQAAIAPRPHQSPPTNRRQQWQTQQQKPTLRCFLCNKPGHIARNCMIKPAAAAELRTPEEDSDDALREAAAPKTLGSRLPPRNNVTFRICRPHNRTECAECFYSPDPTHRCQAAAMTEIFVDTPHYRGPTTAVCMINPIYDLIVGNVKSATEPNPSPHLAGALDAVWIPHSGALEGPDSIDATDSHYRCHPATCERLERPRTGVGDIETAVGEDR